MSASRSHNRIMPPHVAVAAEVDASLVRIGDSRSRTTASSQTDVSRAQPVPASSMTATAVPASSADPSNVPSLPNELSSSFMNSSAVALGPRAMSVDAPTILCPTHASGITRGILR